MKSTLRNMVVVLFTITAVSAFLVGVVNNVTKDTIAKTNAENKLKALTEVLPAFEGEAKYVHDTIAIEGAQIVATRVMRSDDTTVGYAVETHSLVKTGYADKIYLMVGFLEDGTINDIKVLSQKETPGLGANMVKPGNKLEASFKGQACRRAGLRREEGQQGRFGRCAVGCDDLVACIRRCDADRLCRIPVDYGAARAVREGRRRSSAEYEYGCNQINGA